jgi:hypothetical protein
MSYSIPMMPSGLMAGGCPTIEEKAGGLEPLPVMYKKGQETWIRSGEGSGEETEGATLPPLMSVGAEMGEDRNFKKEPLPELQVVSQEGGDGDIGYTDEDLVVAFLPVMEVILSKQGDAVGEGNRMLEPMLRATVRRALAEYSPGARPFQKPGFFDRTMWMLQAMFSSRTYEDIVFEKTHRFQVDEVYLLDVETLALVSFASSDPARHSMTKRVEISAKRVAMEMRGEDGVMKRVFQMQDGRYVVVQAGKVVILAAVVRGQMNDMILADLEFSVMRIEGRFGEQLKISGTALMRTLQPFLEDCLLIQAPPGSGH